MTAVLIAPRIEDPGSDVEPILTSWWYRIRPSRTVSGAQWVIDEWPELRPVSSTPALLDPLAIAYELQLFRGDDLTTPRIHEYRIVPDSASILNWQQLEQVAGPGSTPPVLSELEARVAVLETTTPSGGASTLAGITDMSAFMRSVNDDTSASAARTTLGAAAASHTHGVTDLTATGTKSSSTFLRGDNTWASPPAAGSPAWTDITGKPSTFAPTLPIAESGVTNLTTDLAALDSRLDSLEANGSPVSTQELFWDGTAYKDLAGNSYDPARPRHYWRNGPNPLLLGITMVTGDQWTESIPDTPVGAANMITIGSATHVLDGTDIPRGASQMVRYLRSTTQTVTPTNQYGVEVTVSLTTNLVTAVNNRLSSGSTSGTTIPDGSYVLSGHGGVGAEEPGQWLLTNATVGATVVLGTGTTTPVDPAPVDPQPGSGLPAKVNSMWYFRWQPPYIRNWPSNVQGYTNLIVCGLAQSGGAGTGNLSYSPANGQSVADHAADIRAAVNRGCNVLLGFGGSSDGGITVTNDATATQCFNSIVSLVGTYGFTGIDIDLEPSGSNWTQAGLLKLCSLLKGKYGAAFIIGVTAGLYSTWTQAWINFMVAAGSNADYLAPMLYDFVEASDSRLSTVAVQKCDAIVAGGVPQSKIILGFMVRPNSGYTNATPNMTLIQNAWSAAVAKYPNLRGVFVWEHYIQSTGGVTGTPWTFPLTMGPIIQSAIGSTMTITSFTATAASTTAINLSWAKSGATATGWTLARNGVTIATFAAGTASYADTGLTPGTSYAYTLTGTSSGGSTSASVTGTTTAAAGGTGTWLSGTSGEGAASGAFATWRGEPTPIASTWASDNNNMTQIYPLQAGFEYGSWTGSMDVAIGAINQDENGALGTENWAAAAAGSYDSRWTASLNKVKSEWTRISRGTCYIRFAHELNGNWYGWSVNAANVSNFITAWRRFRGLQQSIFPASKLVFCPNGDTAGQFYDWRTLWPGDTYVDVHACDWYSFHWADGRTVDSYGAPVGLEQHRQFALSKGKPFAVPEWGVDNSSQGDVPEYVTYMNNFFRANGSTTPTAGKVLYECYFNVIWSPNKFGLYPRASSLSKNSSDRYVAAVWGS